MPRPPGPDGDEVEFFVDTPNVRRSAASDAADAGSAAQVDRMAGVMFDAASTGEASDCPLAPVGWRAFTSSPLVRGRRSGDRGRPAERPVVVFVIGSRTLVGERLTATAGPTT